ncbi:ACT domain-containing protein [Blastococcus sp. HT6-30]|uniref:ACT domain-containing protein n=1 Tax=Blastococcus sp. HT6-30 TaxID=3144843 RepID=UPI00321BF295
MVAQDVRPGLPLAEKLGRVFISVAGGLARRLRSRCGASSPSLTFPCSPSRLEDVFSDVVEEQVTYVNAPLFAEQRGLEIDLTSDPESPTYPDYVRVCGAMADGTQVAVAGTLFGRNQLPRLTEADGFEIDLAASGYLLFFVYADRPGVVGAVGAALGEARVNIAGAQVSRADEGGEALMAVTVDTPVGPELLEEIAGRIGARAARAADLTTL